MFTRVRLLLDIYNQFDINIDEIRVHATCQIAHHEHNDPRFCFVHYHSRYVCARHCIVAYHGCSDDRLRNSRATNVVLENTIGDAPNSSHKFKPMPVMRTALWLMAIVLYCYTEAAEDMAHLDEALQDVNDPVADGHVRQLLLRNPCHAKTATSCHHRGTKRKISIWGLTRSKFADGNASQSARRLLLKIWTSVSSKRSQSNLAAIGPPSGLDLLHITSFMLGWR